VALLATAVDFGGIEQVLLTLLRNMDRDVELIPVVFTRSDARSQTFFDRLKSLGIATRTLYVDRNRVKYLNPVRNIIEAVRVLRHEHVDLIHSHGYRADLIALAVSWFLRVPAVSTCHGFTSIDRRLALYSRLNVLLLRRFAQVIAVSARMRDDLLGEGLHPDKVALVTNAVETVGDSTMQSERHATRARLGIVDQEFVLGSVGRLSEEKGVHHLLDALALRAPDHPWRLVIIGDGPRRDELEEMVRRAGLSERVIFAGFQSDVSPWYAAMDVFVLPSLTEGTPMALLEAMARRIPVVASAVGGVPAIISSGVNGLLVPPADTRALSDAIRMMADSGGLRQALSAAGQATVLERYNVSTWVNRVRAVYQQALGEAHA
jgi:glycosyltransferase involved in cell wall biosynthesis